MLSDNSETDTAEDTAAEPVLMLEVTESGEVDFTEPSETTEGESPPQDTEPSEVRKHLITFRVNDAELEAINRRYAETSFRSRGDFCRYSALTVMNVEEDTEDIKQIARYISSISNSFNQVAQYHECRKKLKELFPDGIIPKIKDLQDELKKSREDYAKMSAEKSPEERSGQAFKACTAEARQSKDHSALLAERTGKRSRTLKIQPGFMKKQKILRFI